MQGTSRLLSLLMLMPSLAAQALSLEAFLAEVQQQHRGLHSAQKLSQAALQKAEEAKLQYGTTLFSELTHTDDRSENSNPLLSGLQSRGDRFVVGLSRQECFGLHSKLTYSLQQTKLDGLPPGFAVDKSFTNANLTLELSQPLWKNAGGRDLRLREEQATFAGQAGEKSARFQAKQVLIGAERAYWRLAASQEITKIQRESFQRTQELSTWQQRRVAQNLSDEADLLQARAAEKLREMELSVADHEQRLALRACNELRGQAGETALAVKLPQRAAITSLQPPRRHEERDDTAAQRYSLEAQRRGVELAAHHHDATVDLFAQGGLSGKDPSGTEAFREGMSSKHPQFTVGVRVSVPMDRALIATAQQGYLKELSAAELSFEQAAADQEQQWRDLTQRLSAAKQQLTLVEELEGAQRRKLQAEKTRLQQGRSTSFQLFLFEQEYLSAQLAQVRAAAQVLDIVATLRLFEEVTR